MKWQTFRNMGIARTMKAGGSYLKSAMVKREEQSLEDFYINRFGKVLYGMFLRDTPKAVGAASERAVRRLGCSACKGLSVTAVIKDMFQKYFPKGNKSGRKWKPL